MSRKLSAKFSTSRAGYGNLLGGIAEMLDAARRVSASLKIPQTLSAKCLADISRTPSRKSSSAAFGVRDLAQALPLPWSHYVLLVRRAWDLRHALRTAKPRRK